MPAVPFCHYDTELKVREAFHKRLAARKTAGAINAPHGVRVSAEAKFLSEKWSRRELSGEQMKQELPVIQRKIAAEENQGIFVQKNVGYEQRRRRRSDGIKVLKMLCRLSSICWGPFFPHTRTLPTALRW